MFNLTTKVECYYLCGWIKTHKKTVTYIKIAPKLVNPRAKAGNAGEEEVCSMICQIV